MRYTIFILFILISVTTMSQKGINASEFMDHVRFLADDKLEGRYPGTRGNKKAARYIRKAFENNGIRPIGKSYYQKFEITQKLGLKPQTSLQKIEGITWNANRNFSVFSYSGNGKADAAMVFIGDSLKLLENKTLIKNKWVLMLRQNKSVSLNDYALARKASGNGALGVIYYNPVSDTADELVRLRPGRFKQLTIPVIHINREALEKLYSEYFPGRSLDDATASVSEKRFVAKIKVKGKTVKTSNIVGIIEGSDDVFKNEFIILGAHYDHLGWGGKSTGSRKPDIMAIHNGADDNASGTSALLEIAQELTEHTDKLKRSIIVIAFGAEEGGLLGSAYFVNNPPVPKESIKLMMNMDMVGRLNSDKQLYMGGAGTFPDGEEFMKKLGEGSGLNLIIHAGGVGGSDHVSFYRSGISVIGLHTGGHPQYHTPEDDADLINGKGAELVVRYIFNALLTLASGSQEMYFISQD